MAPKQQAPTLARLLISRVSSGPQPANLGVFVVRRGRRWATRAATEENMQSLFTQSVLHVACCLLYGPKRPPCVINAHLARIEDIFPASECRPVNSHAVATLAGAHKEDGRGLPHGEGPRRFIGTVICCRASGLGRGMWKRK